MACRRIEKYLIPYAERALSEDMRRAVEEHISVCTACAQELAKVTRTVGVLKSVDIPAMEPAHDLRSRVLAQIAEKPVRKPWWKSSALPAYSGVAAMIIVSVLVVRYEPYTSTKQNAMPPTPAPKVEMRSAQDKGIIIQAKPNAQAKAPKVFGRANNHLSYFDGHVHAPKGPVTAVDRVSAQHFRESRKLLYIPKETIKRTPEGSFQYDEDYYSLESKSPRGYLGVPEGNTKSMSQSRNGGGKQLSENKMYAAIAKPEVPFQRNSMMSNASVPGGKPVSDANGAPAAPSTPPTYNYTYSDSDADSVRSKNERGGYGNAFSKADAKEDIFAEVNKDKEAEGKILLLERRLRQFPNSRLVLEELLVAYRSAGRTQDEYSITERMTKLDPDNPMYWFASGQAAEKSNMPKTAVKAYEHAINLKLTQPQLDLAKSRIDALKK